MRICDLSSGAGAITHAVTELRERWDETKVAWHDETCHEFEETHLQPLPGKMQRLLLAIQELTEVLADADKEFSDRGEGIL